MRVAAIYRVSTDKQVRWDGEETIPVQRNAMQQFIAAKGWSLVKEYSEEGVSGYKVSADDRDVLQQAFQDARSGQWQALVVFKADRLSRNSLEYPIVLDRFRKIGVEVWSVKDAAGGKLLALDSQMDKFIRFLEGWQAETESKNTSIRVSEAMLQMAKQGKWTGGRIPYGYELNPARRPKSDTPSLLVKPDEAEVIRRMVAMYLEQRMGSYQVAQALNEAGIRARGGGPWSGQMVRRTLHNPIIAGLPAYGRSKPGTNGRVLQSPYDLDRMILPRDEHGQLKPIPHYQIVPLEQWLRLLEVMQSNSGTSKVKYAVSRRTRAARGLLTGVVYCGHCGSRLALAHQYSYYKRRDGSMSRFESLNYTCKTHVSQGKQFCGGQRQYGRQKLDTAVLDELKRLLTGMAPADLAQLVAGGVKESRSAWRQRLEAARGEAAKSEKVLAGWLQAMDTYHADPGASPYARDVLEEKIRQAIARRDDLRRRLEELQRQAEAPGVSADQLDEFARLAPQWWAFFERAGERDKKVLLRELVQKVAVRRDGVEIKFQVDLSTFLPRARELAAALESPEIFSVSVLQSAARRGQGRSAG